MWSGLADWIDRERLGSPAPAYGNAGSRKNQWASISMRYYQQSSQKKQTSR